MPDFDEFDDITCMAIEITYHKFLRRKKDSQSRYLRINDTQTLDFKQMGIYDSIKKLGDGTTSSSKNYSLGVKVA